MDHGSLYRRCGCRDENTGKLLGARFESSRILWVPLRTIPSLIDAGQISSGTTLVALLYTLTQDASSAR
jgi:hypothetical protein